MPPKYTVNLSNSGAPYVEGKPARIVESVEPNPELPTSSKHLSFRLRGRRPTPRVILPNSTRASLPVNTGRAVPAHAAHFKPMVLTREAPRTTQTRANLVAFVKDRTEHARIPFAVVTQPNPNPRSTMPVMRILTREVIPSKPFPASYGLGVVQLDTWEDLSRALREEVEQGMLECGVGKQDGTERGDRHKGMVNVFRLG